MNQGQAYVSTTWLYQVSSPSASELTTPLKLTSLRTALQFLGPLDYAECPEECKEASTVSPVSGWGTVLGAPNGAARHE